MNKKKDPWYNYKHNCPIKNTANVCFTLNNYTDDDVEMFRNFSCRYIIFGKEVGENGTPHLQGYIQLNKSLPKSTILNYCKRAHWEPQSEDSTNIQARNYCMKEGDWFEKGEMKKQGNRKDLKEVCDAIGNGDVTVDDIIIEKPKLYHQYGRTLEKREELMLMQKYRTYETRTTGVWIFGGTGTDKSYSAERLYTPNGYHPSTHYRWSTEKWQDSYKGQKYVIMNDFRGNDMKYDRLLDLVDWTACFIPRRNRPDLPFTSEKVIITSALSPWDVFYNRHEKDDIAQLLRRFDIYEHSRSENGTCIRKWINSYELVDKHVRSGGSVRLLNNRVVLTNKEGRAEVVRGVILGPLPEMGKISDLVLEPLTTPLINDESWVKLQNVVKDEDFEDLTNL